MPPPHAAGAQAAGAAVEDAHGAAEDACGASQGGEAGEKAVQSPLPKFL